MAGAKLTERNTSSHRVCLGSGSLYQGGVGDATSLHEFDKRLEKIRELKITNRIRIIDLYNSDGVETRK